MEDNLICLGPEVVEDSVDIGGRCVQLATQGAFCTDVDVCQLVERPIGWRKLVLSHFFPSKKY